jgi:transposase
LKVRRELVTQIRHGLSFRQVAKRFGVAVSTVPFWVKRVGDQRLNRVNYSDKSKHPITTNRVDEGVERCVLELRKELKERSDLGEFGAEAIQREMEKFGGNMIPARATINRILQRNGFLDGKHRRRFMPPPKGGYWSNNEQQHIEVDQFDYIEELYLTGGQTL